MLRAVRALAVYRCVRGRSRRPAVHASNSSTDANKQKRLTMAEREHADAGNHQGQRRDPDAAGPRARPCRAHQGTGARRLLRRHRVPPRHRRLHGADRLPAGHRHRRLGQEAQGGIQQGAARARHGLDGARAEPGFRRQPVLHLLRRRALPRRPVHRLGQGDRGHGQRRQDQARRAGAEPGQDQCKARMAADGQAASCARGRHARRATHRAPE